MYNHGQFGDDKQVVVIKYFRYFTVKKLLTGNKCSVRHDLNSKRSGRTIVRPLLVKKQISSFLSQTDHYIKQAKNSSIFFMIVLPLHIKFKDLCYSSSDIYYYIIKRMSIFR